MTTDRPDGAEPDPGRRLMIVALVGAAVLAVAVLAAMGYFLWQRVSQDRDSASVPADFVAASTSDYNKTG